MDPNDAKFSEFGACWNFNVVERSRAIKKLYLEVSSRKDMGSGGL